MIGAIIGDIAGSRFEFDNNKSVDFKLFHHDCDYTDDSICTIATMDWLLNRRNEGYGSVLQSWCRKYNNPMGGYGGSFAVWVRSNSPKPYDSWGNGSAMRVSPVGLFFDSIEDVRSAAEATAVITHNHPEGIKGAMATASAIFLARTTKDKSIIREYITKEFNYDLARSCDDIRPTYQFNESCHGTVPEAIIAFLDSTTFEQAIRLAVSLGGDSDTLTCITGGIAEAYYGVPEQIEQQALAYLPTEIQIILTKFYNHYGNR